MVLQVAIICYLAYSLFVGQFWLVTEKPLGFQTLYVEAPRRSGAVTNAMREAATGELAADVPMCLPSAAGFPHNFTWSAGWPYSFEGACAAGGRVGRGVVREGQHALTRPLAAGCVFTTTAQAYSKTSDSFFITTSVEVTEVVKVDAPRFNESNAECAEALRRAELKGLDLAPCGEDVDAAASWRPTGGINGECFCSHRAPYIMPGAEEVKLSVDHAFVAQSASGNAPVTRVRLEGNSTNLATFEAQETITFTLKDLLGWVHVDLDSPADAGDNAEWLLLTNLCRNDCGDGPDGVCNDGGPGSADSTCDLGTDCSDCGARKVNQALQGPSGMAEGKFPTPRLSGLSVQASMKYYNYNLHDDTKQGDSTTAPVCIMELRPTIKWVSLGDKEPNTVRDLEEYKGLYPYGVQVIFTSTGQIGRFDFPTFLTALVNAAVLLGVTVTITKVVAQHLMGQRSKLYKRYIDRDVSFEEEYAAFALQAIAAGKVFDLLDHDGGGSLCRDELKAELVRNFGDMLTPDEMGVLIDFVFKYANKEAERIAENAQDSGAQDAKGGTANLSTSADGDQIDKRAFVELFCHGPADAAGLGALAAARLERHPSAVGSGANANASFYDLRQGGAPAAGSGANADASFYDLRQGAAPAAGSAAPADDSFYDLEQ